MGQQAFPAIEALNALQVIHVVRDLDESSGGPSRSVPALAESQARLGNVDVAVWFQDRGKRIVPITPSEVKYRALGGSALAVQRALEHEFGSVGQGPGAMVIHLHGLWSSLLHACAKEARQRRYPYLVSSRGMLSGWALGHKAWKKKLAWKLYQESDLRRADCLVASSEFERQDIAGLLPGQRIEVIPNGCEAPPPSSQLSAGGCVLTPGSRWALALGRLHPVKGYAELIQTWANLRPTGWKLAIAGPDEDGYRCRLEQLIRQHQLQESVVMLGAVDDRQKWSLLEQCELFVAPSKTENFGMAIAEALQAGKPVITTTGTPWRELQEYHCGWWVESDVIALGQALGAATTANAEDLETMGMHGQLLIEEKYSWGQVAADTIAVYRSLLSGSIDQRHSCTA